MNICQECGEKIPYRTFVNGKQFTLHKRKYCLKCSPIGTRKKCGPKPKYGRKLKGKEIEVLCNECGKKYITKYCIYKCSKCRTKKVRKKRKINAIKNLGGKCKKCGYNKSFQALHFHHIDPTIKKFTISCNFERNIKELVEEINKCIILCANCHAEYHEGLWQIEQIK